MVGGGKGGENKANIIGKEKRIKEEQNTIYQLD